MIFVTDGTFEGILSAVFEAYAHKEEPEAIVSRAHFQLTLFSEVRDIETQPDKSDRVYRSVVEKMSQEAIEELYRAYLGEDPDVGLAIYRYIKVGLKVGRRVLSYLQHPDVLRVHDMSRRVAMETHTFTGILRFTRLKNGIYYAKMEPDNNIIMLLAPHFADRLNDQPWIIHDAKRNLYALYNTEQVVFSDEVLPIRDDERDEEFELLWRKYFQAIAIESRINPRLQRAFMPRRYWKNLPEKNKI
jgi:probable DNA metabolism protein